MQCLRWAEQKIKEDDSSIVKIHNIRGGEKNGRVVAEITGDGLRQIADGRLFPVTKLGR